MPSRLGERTLLAHGFQNRRSGELANLEFSALRAAQLEMLNTQEYQHPQYWAAFVPSGYWTALSGQ